jgi:hypothetical protein
MLHKQTLSWQEIITVNQALEAEFRCNTKELILHLYQSMPIDLNVVNLHRSQTMDAMICVCSRLYQGDLYPLLKAAFSDIFFGLSMQISLLKGTLVAFTDDTPHYWGSKKKHRDHHSPTCLQLP